MGMPCYKCPDKYPACSTKCTKSEYLEDRAKRELIKENKSRENQINFTIINSIAKGKEKKRRRLK